MRIPEYVEQPHHIQVPAENDPLAWAKHPIVYTRWLEAVAPQFEAEDEARHIHLAEALDCFTGDDNNIFVYKAREMLTPENGLLAKQMFQIRIGWERAAPLLPRRVKALMGRVRNLLDPLDWTQPEDYNQAVVLRRPLVESARRITMVNEVCDLAFQVRELHKATFDSAWEEFYRQHKTSS